MPEEQVPPRGWRQSDGSSETTRNRPQEGPATNRPWIDETQIIESTTVDQGDQGAGHAGQGEKRSARQEQVKAWFQNLRDSIRGGGSSNGNGNPPQPPRVNRPGNGQVPGWFKVTAAFIAGAVLGGGGVAFVTRGDNSPAGRQTTEQGLPQPDLDPTTTREREVDPTTTTEPYVPEPLPGQDLRDAIVYCNMQDKIEDTWHFDRNTGIPEYNTPYRKGEPCPRTNPNVEVRVGEVPQGGIFGADRGR